MQINKQEEHFFIPAAQERQNNSLRASSYKHIVDIIALLENQGPELGVESFSIDCTSLEQIFMAMLKKENKEEEEEKG